MNPARYDINDGRTGNTWRYSFDFKALSASPSVGYLANLSAARFLVVPECGDPLEWDLDSGLIVDDVTHEETTYVDALLRIEPDNPLEVAAGQHFYALRLEWESGDVLDVIEGHWTVSSSPFEATP